MKSNYKRLGDYIKQIKIRNIDLKAKELLGINVNKHFMPSVANIVGTDLTNYKLVQKNQFACNRMHVGRDYRIPIAVSESEEPFMVSPAYDVFEIKNSKELLPEYLMMWFERAEFDRNAWFFTDADVRGGLAWQAFEDMQLPVPHIDKQREIVKEYNNIQNRINLNQQLIQKLEETAQAIYREWFVEFEFPDKNGKPYKSNGGEMVWNEELGKEIPKGWEVKDLGNVIEYKKGYAFKSDDYTQQGNSIIRVSDLGQKYVNKSEFFKTEFNKYFEVYKVSYSDLIITTVGSWPSNPLSVVGKLVRVPSFADGFYLNQNMVRIRPERGISEIIYIQLIQKAFSDYLVSGAQGSANQASITLEHTFKFRVLVPNIENLNSFFKQINNYIDSKIIENQKLTELKELLLSRLATVE